MTYLYQSIVWKPRVQALESLEKLIDAPFHQLAVVVMIENTNQIVLNRLTISAEIGNHLK